MFLYLTDENDFNSTVLVVMFPADENSPRPISEIDVPIPIFDDDVDEAESQFFYTIFEVLNATNPDLVQLREQNFTVAMCSIRDNDSEYYTQCYIINVVMHFLQLFISVLHEGNMPTMNQKLIHLLLM